MYSLKEILGSLVLLTPPAVTNRRGQLTGIRILVNVQKGLAPFQAQKTYSDVLVALK